MITAWQIFRFVSCRIELSEDFHLSESLLFVVIRHVRFWREILQKLISSLFCPGLSDLPTLGQLPKLVKGSSVLVGHFAAVSLDGNFHRVILLFRFGVSEI